MDLVTPAHLQQQQQPRHCPPLRPPLSLQCKPPCLPRSSHAPRLPERWAPSHAVRSPYSQRSAAVAAHPTAVRSAGPATGITTVPAILAPATAPRADCNLTMPMRTCQGKTGWWRGGGGAAPQRWNARQTLGSTASTAGRAAASQRPSSQSPAIHSSDLCCRSGQVSAPIHRKSHCTAVQYSCTVPYGVPYCTALLP